jgi:hypothetical protein
MRASRTFGVLSCLAVGVYAIVVRPWLVRWGATDEEWQEIKLGDRLTAWSPEGPVSAWDVAALETEHFLGLRGLSDLRGRPFDPRGPWPGAYMDGLWGFRLEELPGYRTRLVVSGYQTGRPRWLQAVGDFLLYPPMHWPMQTRQFANLKRRAEREWAQARTNQARR